MAVSILVIVLFNALPDMLLKSGSGSPALAVLPLIGYLLVGVSGFLLVYQFWARRDSLKARYGALSYQRIFPVGFAGITLVMSLAVHPFIRYWHLSPSFWASSPLHFLVVPLEAYAGAAAPAVFWVRMAAAALLTIAGLVICIRSLQTFGVDYMTLVYLYFPEESRIQDHSIYSILRHPAYAGILTLARGGMCFTFTPYTILFLLVFLAGFYIHIRCVEEKELIARFGQSYRDYIKRVPAFFVRPGQVGALLRFLVGAL